MVAVRPQRIADDRDWLMGVIFLLRKHASQDRRRAERREDTSREPRCIYLFRNRSAGEFIVRGDVAAYRGKSARRLGVSVDLACRDRNARSVSQMISEHH